VLIQLTKLTIINNIIDSGVNNAHSVTGHNGYIGTVLTPMLVTAGHEVIGLDTDLYQRCTFGDGLPEVPTIKKGYSGR
jgi:hypothetical protein